jgi:hypothetical protein
MGIYVTASLFRADWKGVVMLSVEIHKLDKDGNDMLAGTIWYDGKGFRQDPPSKLLTNILAEPILLMTANGPRKCYAAREPELFLSALFVELKSPYLRATRVKKEIEDEPSGRNLSRSV